VRNATDTVDRGRGPWAQTLLLAAWLAHALADSISQLLGFSQRGEFGGWASRYHIKPYIVLFKNRNSFSVKLRSRCEHYHESRLKSLLSKEEVTKQASRWRRPILSQGVLLKM
jgi:hypothetical protein